MISKTKMQISIEGNIGSGKSTLLNYFNKYSEVCTIQEPVGKWKNCGGVNLLEEYYRNPEEWVIPFQNYVFLTMHQIQVLKTDKKIKLMERSLLSTRHIFLENLVKRGSISQKKFKILNEWYSYFLPYVNLDLIIYLRTSPEISYQRMKKRGRKEEDVVSYKYIEDLHIIHEEWLGKMEQFNSTDVLIINGDLDEKNIIGEYRKILSALKIKEN